MYKLKDVVRVLFIKSIQAFYLKTYLSIHLSERNGTQMYLNVDFVLRFSQTNRTFFKTYDTKLLHFLFEYFQRAYPYTYLELHKQFLKSISIYKSYKIN